jgi:hypothetical protein
VVLNSLVYLVFSLIISSIFLFDCSNGVFSIIIFLQYGIFLFFPMLGVFILSMGDILYNLNILCQCKIFKFFVEDDPYYYRFETVMFFTNTFLILVYLPIDLVLQNFSDPYYHVLDNIFYFYFHKSNAFILIGFVSIITIFNLCYKKQVVKEDFIESVLNNPQVYDLVLKFSIKEWSSENILILRDINEFKELMDYDMRVEYAKSIESNYLNYTLSPMEVNIDGGSINAFKLRMKGINQETILFLFNEVEVAIKKNLDDTLMRFQTSKDFLKFKNDQEIFKNLKL